MRQNPCFEAVARSRGCIVASFFQLGWLWGLGGWAGGVCMSLEVLWAPSTVFEWFTDAAGHVVSPLGL